MLGEAAWPDTKSGSFRKRDGFSLPCYCGSSRRNNADSRTPIGGGRPVVNTLKDVGVLLLVVLLCPVAILVVGAPVALIVRLLIEIVARL